MLLFLFILSTVSFILVFVLQTMVKKNNLGKLYTILSVIQAASIGASFGLLLSLVTKGRIIG